MSHPKAKIVEPQSPPRELTIQGVLSAGRSRSCDIQLNATDTKISKKHFEIGEEGGRVWVKDLNSSNGTRVGKKVLPAGERHWLQHGDVVLLGDTRIEIWAPPPDEGLDATITAVAQKPPVNNVPSTLDATMMAPVNRGAASPALGDVTMVPPALADTETKRPQLPARQPAPEPAPEPARTPPQPPPQQRPTPARVAAPQPHPSPPPAPESEPEPESAEPFEATIVNEGSRTQKHLAAAARLAKAKPRLVFHDEQKRQIEFVKATPFRVGRDAKAHCVVAVRAVSNDHAHIALAADGSFFLEDMRTPNRTFVYEASLGQQALRTALAPNTPRELRSWTRISFAGVDAVFVTDRDNANQVVPVEPFDRGLDLARRRKLVDATAVADAEREAGELGVHPAEVLIRDGQIEVGQFLDLVAEGGARGKPEPTQNRWLLIAVLVIAAAAIGFVANLFLGKP